MVFPLQDIGAVDPLGALKSLDQIQLQTRRNELFNIQRQDRTVNAPLIAAQRESDLRDLENKAMFGDISVLTALMDAGQDSAVISFLQQSSRPEAANALQILNSGNQEEIAALEQDFSALKQAGIDAGFIAGPTVAKPTVLAKNAIAIGSTGETIASNIQQEPDKPRKTEKDAGGFLRFVDDGSRVFPDTQGATPERKTARARDDTLRFVDTGERVFPDAQAIQPPPDIRNDRNGVPRFFTGPDAGQPVFSDVIKTPPSQVRPATLEEIIANRLQPGTSAQIRENGELTNIIRPTNRQEAIANMVAQGQTEQRAANIFDRVERAGVNPVTGFTQSINQLGPSTTEIQDTTPPPSIPAPPSGQTLWELAPDATGIVSGISAVAGKTFGLGGLGVGKEAIKAQQQIKVATRELIRSLVVGDRITATEIGIIEKEIDLNAGTFVGLPVLRSRMRAINDSLTVRMQQAERDFQNTRLDPESRRKQGANANFIRNFLVTLGVPSTGVELQALDGREAALLNQLDVIQGKNNE